MDKFLNYLYELERTGVGLERVHSFKHALSVGDEIALEIESHDRKGKTAFNYYWDIGMGIAENDIPEYAYTEEVVAASYDGVEVVNSITSDVEHEHSNDVGSVLRMRP